MLLKLILTCSEAGDRNRWTLADNLRSTSGAGWFTPACFLYKMFADGYIKRNKTAKLLEKLPSGNHRKYVLAN